jgi:hypothetical protein
MALIFLLGARWVWVVTALPQGMTRDPYRRLDKYLRRSARVWNILLLPGFDPRTSPPVTSRYTGYATPAPYTQYMLVVKEPEPEADHLHAFSSKVKDVKLPLMSPYTDMA